MNPQPQTCSDAELTHQAQAGSMAAFEELVYRYEARLFGYLAQCCRNHEDAREITQDAFVKAYQAISRFNLRKEFGPWLFTIARRTWIDRLRLARPPCDAPMPVLEEPTNPSDALICAEERTEIWTQAATLLPPAQYEALWLRYAEELSVSDTARVVGKSATYVKVLLFRARRTLARHLPRKDLSPVAAVATAEVLPAPSTVLERT